MHIFDNDFKTELRDVDAVIMDNLVSWWPEINKYINQSHNHIWHSLPVVVFSIYRYLGVDKRVTLLMASVFKMVHMGNAIHAYVKDDEEGQLYNRDLQFSILLGDYLFGKILNLLLEAQAHKHLDTLTRTICEVNEGMIMRYKTNEDNHKIIEKTSGSLYAAAFETAAKMAGVDPEQIGLYIQLGYHIGMSLEMINNESYKDNAYLHVHKCQDIFNTINEEKNILNSSLERGINELHSLICPCPMQAAVI